MKTYFFKNKIEILFLITITTFAFFVRFIAIQNFGDLWTDELYSYYFANQKSMINVCKTLFLEDFHVPFYYILLHYWIKIFGNTDITMRLMGCILTTMCIPVSFYIVKNFFNKLSAYFVCIFLSVNAFNIHYSAELRHYGLSILLALISTFFFVKMFDKFDKKVCTIYILVSVLLMYTCNFSSLYIFCQFLIGVIYLLIKNKNFTKLFLITYFITAICYIPALMYVIHSSFVYKKSLMIFARDVFYFDLSYFWAFLMTTYSNIFEQFMSNNPKLNMLYITHIFTPENVLFILMPIILGITGFVLFLHSRNKNIILFLAPALLLFIFQLIGAFTHNLALTLRYNFITITIIFIISVCGYCMCKNKKIAISLLIIYLLLNILCYGAKFKHNIFNRNLNFDIPMSKNVYQIDINTGDTIFIPRFGKIYKNRYFQNLNVIDFDTYDAFFINTRPDIIKFIFGEELSKKLNRKMMKTYMYDYLSTDMKMYSIYKYMNNEYYSKMKKGNKFIIITDEARYFNILPATENLFRENINIYKLSAIYDTLSAKIVFDIVNSAKTYLKKKKIYNVNNIWTIYVFEK